MDLKFYTPQWFRTSPKMTPTASTTLVTIPPALTPPVHTPPMLTPPMLTPPVLTSPVLTPSVHTPTVFTSPMHTPTVFTRPMYMLHRQVLNPIDPCIWPSHYCKDSQKISLKLFTIVTHFVNFKHNFPKEIETFFKNKLKWIQEICFKMNPLSSELPFHIHNWLIISFKNFCIVIRKWPSSKSLMWSKNKRGPKTVPCRMPDSRWTKTRKLPSTTTHTKLAPISHVATIWHFAILQLSWDFFVD